MYHSGLRTSGEPDVLDEIIGHESCDISQGGSRGQHSEDDNGQLFLDHFPSFGLVWVEPDLKQTVD